jgi:hypothetical protein
MRRQIFGELRAVSPAAGVLFPRTDLSLPGRLRVPDLDVIEEAILPGAAELDFGLGRACDAGGLEDDDEEGGAAADEEVRLFPPSPAHCVERRDRTHWVFLKPDPDYIQFRPYGAISTPFRVSRPGERPARRSRRIYFVLVLVVIGLGLLWRSGLVPFPELVAKMGGDALWSVVVFLGIGFLLPRIKTFAVALVALLFSYTIECTQLYHAPWIDYWRSFRLGALILGTTFNWPDFGAYTIGVAVAVVVDWLLLRLASR